MHKKATRGRKCANSRARLKPYRCEELRESGDAKKRPFTPARLFRVRTLRFPVFDAQDVDPAVMAREQPVEKRRPGISHVDVAGGVGSETN